MYKTNEMNFTEVKIKYRNAVRFISSQFISQSIFKPKFHYTDFATKSALSQTQIMKVADTNHESWRRDLCRGEVPVKVGVMEFGL